MTGHDNDRKQQVMTENNKKLQYRSVQVRTRKEMTENGRKQQEMKGNNRK